MVGAMNAHHEHQASAPEVSGHRPEPSEQGEVREYAVASHVGHAGHEVHEAHAGHDTHVGHDEPASHEDHAGHGGHVAIFRRLFWIMLVLAVPVVAFSPMFAHILGYELPMEGWTAWIAPVLGTVMYAWGGRPFLGGAVGELRARKPAMMTLIALAITVAFLSSWGSSLHLLPMTLEFWWELALLIVIMLLGHWIEMRSLAATSSALDSLAALLPEEAERIEGGDIVTVTPGALRVGDLVMVRPGGAVPADGIIAQGEAHLDESLITGESAPVKRGQGDSVVAGTVATDSGLRVRVTAAGENTALAGISRMVAEAQSSTTRAQRLADTAAGWLFWFALGAAVVTAIVWAVLGHPDSAVERTITVLVVACPHALGLAIPLVVSIATAKAARSGLLVKDRLALEAMRAVDAVLFDKTGTLTEGAPAVTAALPVRGVGEGELLALAAAAEVDSEHPLARAIVAAAAERGLEVPAATGFVSHPAVGVRALVGGAVVRVGGPALLAQEGIQALDVAAEWGAEGATVLHVTRDGAVIGALRLADAIRPESRAAVAALLAQGVEVVMITGDAEPVARHVAAELGIDRVFAGVRPEDKAGKVAELRAEGKRVAMVGDGVNDAPALASADVGIAMGGGTDVAIGSAGVVLASGDPRAVVALRTLSVAAYSIMKQNLWWAAGYNPLAVPIAAGVLAPWGIVMPMSVGALLMSASTVVVALNAQRLRRVDLRLAAVGH
jgi:Cu2+-exporting ATPase